MTLLMVPGVAFLCGLILCVGSLPVCRLKPALLGAVKVITAVWVIHPLVIEGLCR